MNTYLSDKIKLLSFISIILVVTIHTNIGFVFFYETGRSDYFVFIKNFISNGIAVAAVPLFFSFSGYLFFINPPIGRDQILLKIQKRIKSLAVPYLFWSILGLITFLVLVKLALVQTDFLEKLSIFKIIITICLKPIPFQLWFIRNLVLLILISPVIYLLIKHFGYVLAILSGLIWLSNIDFIPTQGIVNGNQSLSLFFFVVGCTIALKKGTFLLRNFSKYAIVFVSIWILLLFINTYYDSISVINIKSLSIIEEGKIIYLLLFKLSILLGVGALWCAYDSLFFTGKNVSQSSFYSISQYTFFIYACHEPLQSIVRSLIENVTGTKDVFFFSYLLVLLITFFLTISLAFLTKRYLPTTYGIATGWR